MRVRFACISIEVHKGPLSCEHRRWRTLSLRVELLHIDHA